MLKFRRLAASLSLSFAVLIASAPASLVAAQEGENASAAEDQADGEADSEEGENAEANSEGVPSEGPFLDAMSRLSTVAGSLHFLRELCADENQGVWRSRISDFLDAQELNDADRRRLIASFNSGYRAFQSTYRHCTPAARLAHNRYQKEGAALSRDMLTRYGN